MDKIILIEDDMFLHDLYKHVLEKAGYTVAEASNGETGIKVVKENTDARLILLDIMLPKVHGIDVLRAIKQDDSVKNIPVIMLSNLGEEGVIAEAFKLGARDFLKKVRVMPQQFVEYVNSYIKDPNFKVGKTEE